MNTIYVAGHKSPDLDSVMGSISYAYLKSNLDKENQYQPVITGELNNETQHVINQFKLEEPLQMDSIAGEKVIMVDHNEAYQAIDGIDDAEVLEVIDHHRMSFDYHTPIKIIVEPIGSSCSVIYKLFQAENVAIPKNLAGGMLAAILTDTVITKSPTTTQQDKSIIEVLAQIAGIKDWREFGMDIFKVRSSVSDKSAPDIIESDYKDFDLDGKKVGVGQVESVDVSEFSDRRDEIIAALQDKKFSGKYHTVILFITDIMNEESHFYVSSEETKKVAEGFNAEDDHGYFVAPVLSRKKQVIPSLTKALQS